MNRHWAYAALIYLAIALFQLFPAWTDPAHGVIGDWTHPDTLGNHWIYRWIAESLSDGASILHNDRYYYPIGDAPFLAGNGSDAVPYTLIGSWLAWPFSVTVWTLLTLVLNGMSGFALARAAGASNGGAIVAGAALLFCPYVPRELSAGRFAQASLWACGFFLASWLRLLEAPSIRRGVVAGVLFGAAAFTYWYDGLWMAMAGAIFWLFQPRLKPLTTFVPMALLATLPPLGIFLMNWKEIPGTTEYTFPHPISITYALTPTFPVWSGTAALSSVTLPMGVSVLAIAGWSKATRAVRLGAALGAVWFYLLALGPELLYPDGTSSGFSALYPWVYRWSSSLQRFWWPYRHIAPLTLVLVPLVGHGAERVVRWLAIPGASVAVAALLPLELYARGASVSVETSWFKPPAAYEKLAALEPGNVLELPLAGCIARTESSVSYQWVHHHPLINGHAMWVDRVRPTAWNDWITQQPLLDALLRFEKGELTGDWSLPADTALVSDGALRYITLSREYFPGELQPLLEHHVAMLTAWFGEPIVRAGGVRIWDIQNDTGVRSWTFTTWSPPAGYVSQSGMAALPDSVRSPGWRNWARSFPPVAPSDHPVKADDDRYAQLPAMIRRQLERKNPAPDTGTMPEEDAQ